MHKKEEYACWPGKIISSAGLPAYKQDQFSRHCANAWWRP